MIQLYSSFIDWYVQFTTVWINLNPPNIIDPEKANSVVPLKKIKYAFEGEDQ